MHYSTPRERVLLAKVIDSHRIFAGVLLVAVMLLFDAAPALASHGLPATQQVPAWAKERRIIFVPAHKGEGSGGPVGYAPERRCEEGYCPSVPLFYGNGQVQHAPSLHVIFWGGSWNNFALFEHGVIQSFYKAISGSPWQGILTEYFDTSGNISPTITVDFYTDGTKTVSPTSINDTKIREEVNAAVKAKGWTRETNSQFVVIPQPSATYAAGFGSGFCAYHGVEASGASYTFAPYAGTEPFASQCKGYDPEGNALHVTTMLASHEYAESATDPFINAWRDSEGFEIADICASHDEEVAGLGWVQGLWDEKNKECMNSFANPPQVYAQTEAATGIGTTEATLHGIVNPEGRESTYYFEWGKTLIPLLWTQKSESVNAGSGRAMVGASTTATELASKATYYYRVCAHNSTGTHCGEVRSLTTS
jgi:hypothetical protein